MPASVSKFCSLSFSQLNTCCSPKKSFLKSIFSNKEGRRQNKDYFFSPRAHCNLHILTSVLKFHHNISQISSSFLKCVITSAPGIFHSEFDSSKIPTSAESFEFSSMSQRIMDSQPSRSPSISVSCLNSMEKMKEWLEQRLPSGDETVKSWGSVPGTKCVSNLWTEFITGEISLEDSCPPKRTVEVVSIKIRDKLGRVLIESHQMLSNGNLRLRNRPLSEKMKPGETVEEASFRGIEEELGPVLGARANVELNLESYRLEIQERESFSYPGLLSHYIVHQLNAHIQNLPEDDFTTTENEACNTQSLDRQEISIDSTGNPPEVLLYSDSNSSRTSIGMIPVNEYSLKKNSPVGVRVHYWSWKNEF